MMLECEDLQTIVGDVWTPTALARALDEHVEAQLRAKAQELTWAVQRELDDIIEKRVHEAAEALAAIPKR